MLMGPTRVQCLDTCEGMKHGLKSPRNKESNGTTLGPHVSSAWTRVRVFLAQKGAYNFIFIMVKYEAIWPYTCPTCSTCVGPTRAKTASLCSYCCIIPFPVWYLIVILYYLREVNCLLCVEGPLVKLRRFTKGGV